MGEPDPMAWMLAVGMAYFTEGPLTRREAKAKALARIIAKHYKRHSRMQHGLPPLERPPLGPAPDYAKPQLQSPTAVPTAHGWQIEVDGEILAGNLSQKEAEAIIRYYTKHSKCNADRPDTVE